LISVPIAHQGEPIGVLIVINKENGDAFNAEDSLKLESLVRFAAVAIANATLMRDKLQQQRLQQELELASTIQNALLPKPSAHFDGATIEAVYKPAGQVGGDYFDVIPISDSEFDVIVGDVCNKGVPAALQLAAVRSAFRLEARDYSDITELIERLNAFICKQVMLTDSMFISLVFARFNLKEKSCTYINAGHIPPVHVGRERSDFRLLKTGGVAVGQFPDFRYSADTIKLSSGDRILFFTDGLNESVSPTGELFGRERVHQLAVEYRDCRIKDFPGKFLEASEAHRGGGNSENADDTTLIVVEVS
jgi:serine phosphatase RsbU (regulator of sigma subunit)